MSSDCNDLLSSFDADRVAPHANAGVERSREDLVVGGHAVMFYSEPRYTKDLDIWVDVSTDNAARVYRALAEFGAPPKGVMDEEATPL